MSGFLSLNSAETIDVASASAAGSAEIIVARSRRNAVEVSFEDLDHGLRDLLTVEFEEDGAAVLPDLDILVCSLSLSGLVRTSPNVCV
jgi:hypothetical protein